MSMEIAAPNSSEASICSTPSSPTEIPKKPPPPKI
jgi:hypothetical protein